MEKFSKNKNEKIVLVSNIGSASRKYSVYSVDKKEKFIEELFSINFDQKESYPDIKLDKALYAFFDIAKKKYTFSISDIDVFVERVVAVGEYFLEDKIIDEKYLEVLKSVEKYDSLHTKSLLNEIRQIFSIREVCQNKKIKCEFKLVAISDSTFHATIPKESYTYAISQHKDPKETKFRKYGYHGISMSEVKHRLAGKYQRVIAVHLGGGGSVTAMKDSQSIYNSFGMTPLSGLINLTRTGDIDPFVVLDTLNSHKKSFRFLSSENYLYENTAEQLYERSGLFALTGEKDMRNILENVLSQDIKISSVNNFALDVYINKINEIVGSAFANLGGIEALVLTGQILEKSEYFRSRFLEKISWLPVKKENVLVFKTEEEREMVRLVIEKGFL